MEALAEVLDPSYGSAPGPTRSRDLRAALESHPDADVRTRGPGGAPTGARGCPRRGGRRTAETLRDALAALDETFVELTERDATRNPGMAYGARTLSYLDCMRDLDVTMGPALVADMAPALQTLFEAGRWYSGRVNAIGRRVVEEALPEGGRGPFMPVLMQVMRTLMQFPPEVGETVQELHDRLGRVLADQTGDNGAPATSRRSRTRLAVRSLPVGRRADCGA